MEVNRARDGWLRAKGARPLMAATYAVSLVFGGAFLAVDRLHATPADAVGHPSNPVTDEQSRAQAVDAAKRVVGVGRLHPTTAGYQLMSCVDQSSPPYHGAVYVTFAVPAETRADNYLSDVATALVADGWKEGLPAGDHAFGRTLSKDDVIAVIYRHDDEPNLGVLRVYGECRNMSDHRGSAATWADIIGQISPAS